MQWVFVTLLLALQPGAAALIAKCDNVAQLSGLKGEIYAVGGADASEPCGWHIYPNRRLERMEFNVTESRLQGGDQLAFYSYKLQHPSTTVGTFSVSNQVPSQLELRGAEHGPKFLARSSAVVAQGDPLGARGESSAPGCRSTRRRPVACATLPIPTQAPTKC